MRLKPAQKGLAVRTIAAAGAADYVFAPGERCERLLARVSAEFPADLLICWQPEMFPPLKSSARP